MYERKEFNVLFSINYPFRYLITQTRQTPQNCLYVQP